MTSQATVARTNISLAFLMLFLCAVENTSLVLWYSFYFLYNFLLCSGSKWPNQADRLVCFLTIFCTWKVCSCTFNTISFVLHNFFLNSLISLDQPTRKSYLMTLWITEICPPEIPFAFTVVLPLSSPKEKCILSFPHHWHPSSSLTSSTTFLCLLVRSQHFLWQSKRRAAGVWLCQHVANS